MAAAAPIALAAAATGLNAYSAYGQIQTANQAAKIQREQIRQQQVQLRLQENQESIERMKNLQKIVATEVVQFGARGMGPGSGTAMAIINQNFVDFQEDNTASKLNYLSKQVGLDTARRSVDMERRARVTNAAIGFGKDTVGIGMALYGMPSSSLVAKSAPTESPFNLNR